ncbi:MAG: hypothetical protein ACREKS_05085, partial [Candidatus Rokuibacteriota bacterium]
MRREADGRYSYVAIDHEGFDLGDFVHIHSLFPETYRATEDTWRAGEMMHSQLFGGHAGGEEYAQFVQINTPLKLDGRAGAWWPSSCSTSLPTRSRSRCGPRRCA